MVSVITDLWVHTHVTTVSRKIDKQRRRPLCGGLPVAEEGMVVGDIESDEAVFQGVGTVSKFMSNGDCV